MKKANPLPAALRVAVLLTGLIGIAFNTALAAEVYTWTDEDGVTHFSDKKPAHADSRVIELDDVQPASDMPSQSAAAGQLSDQPGDPSLSAAQQRRSDVAAQSASRREEQAVIEEICGRHRQRLEQMEPARRVYYIDENGQQVRMDDVQRVALIEESRNYIAENCN